MNKLKEKDKNNIVSFPSHINEGDREVEAIIFAASEPLDIDTIESKISKKVNVKKTLEKLKIIYSNRGINLVCISKKWSFIFFNINCIKKFILFYIYISFFYKF